MSESEVANIVRRLERIESKIDDQREDTSALREAISALNERVKHAEQDIKLAHSRISAFKKWAIGGLATVAAGAGKYIWSIIESIARKG